LLKQANEPLHVRGLLEECGVPLSVFHPLNHAMPLKQTTGNARRSVKHVYGRHSTVLHTPPVPFCTSGRSIQRSFLAWGPCMELVPVYRQVGVFSQQLENIDLLPTDVQWLVRLLEHKVLGADLLEEGTVVHATPRNTFDTRSGVQSTGSQWIVHRI
jgi:hypothetical protein